MAYRLPQLGEYIAQTTTLQQFAGYDGRAVPARNAFADMENLSGGRWPALSVRPKRKRVRLLEGATALFARDALGWVAGDQLWYDGRPVATVTPGEKRIACMSAYVVVFPDKLCYNTRTGQVTHLDNRVEAEQATLTLTDDAGTPLVVTAAAEAPEEGLWLDTGTHTLKQQMEGVWTVLPNVYVRLEAAGLGTGFAPGDWVEVTCSEPLLCGRFALRTCDDGSVTLSAPLPVPGTVADVAAERAIPDLDFVVHNDNRLWGCSSRHNEIYACKLGDPTNWYSYAGLSTDSYAASIGSAGPFTGMAVHQGYVLFFKEDAIHKLYGTKPANYQITQTGADGVAAGSHASICNWQDTLLYLSPNGPVQYTGSLPVPVGTVLGDTHYRNGRAGLVDSRYYLSAQDGENKWHLLVLDGKTGLWHRQDDTRCFAFAACGGCLYYLSDGALWEAEGQTTPYETLDAALEGDVRWQATTGHWNSVDENNAYVTGLRLRMELEDGAWLRVALAYDGSDRFEPVGLCPAGGRRAVTVPIVPRRCDSFRLRLTGQGEACLLSLRITTQPASEMGG